MKKRIILKVISVSPKERTEFARRYDFKNRIPSMAYTIDVPEDVKTPGEVQGGAHWE